MAPAWFFFFAHGCVNTCLAKEAIPCRTIEKNIDLMVCGRSDQRPAQVLAPYLAKLLKTKKIRILFPSYICMLCWICWIVSCGPQTMSRSVSSNDDGALNADPRATAAPLWFPAAGASPRPPFLASPRPPAANCWYSLIKSSLALSSLHGSALMSVFASTMCGLVSLSMVWDVSLGHGSRCRRGGCGRFSSTK